MKNIFKKLSCALLAAAMICAITPFTASADSSFVPPKTQVSYMGAKSNYYAYGVIQLYNVPSKSSISKSNIKVISGKSVVSLESLTKDVSSGRTEYFAKGVKAYSYSNHTYRIGYNMLKTGTAKIQYKVGRKTYSTTVKVLPYTNPLKSLTVTGVGNLASRFSKNSSKQRPYQMYCCKRLEDRVYLLLQQKNWYFPQYLQQQRCFFRYSSRRNSRSKTDWLYFS